MAVAEKREMDDCEEAEVGIGFLGIRARTARATLSEPRSPHTADIVTVTQTPVIKPTVSCLHDLIECTMWPSSFASLAPG